MDFSGNNLMKYIPEILKEYDNNHILPKIFNVSGKVLKEVQDLTDTFLNILDIDLCDVKYLPYLANLIGWRLNASDPYEQQRAQLKTAIQWYKIKGTKLSYYNMFRLLGYEIKLEELWKDIYGNYYTSSSNTSAVLYGNSTSPGDWESRASVTMSTLYASKFHSLLEGIVVGQNGKLMYTDDAAITWNTVNSNVSYDLYSIAQISLPYYFISGQNGTLLRYHWTNKIVNAIPIATTQSLNCISFSKELLMPAGYIVGSGGSIWKNGDGSGASWQTLSTNFNGAIYYVCVIDKDKFFALAESNTVLISVDGGTTINKITIPGCSNSQIWLSGYFFDSNTGYIVGNNGKLAYTSNGGASWGVVEIEPNVILQSIKFSTINPSVGFISASNNIFRYTIDGGTTWTPLSNIQNIFYNIEIYDTLGLSVGSDGSMLKCTTVLNPSDWSYISLDNPYKLNDMLKVGGTAYYIVGDNGAMLYSTNSGASWVNLPTPTTRDFYVVYYNSNDDALYLGGSKGTVYKLTNSNSIPNPIGSWTFTNMSLKSSSRIVYGIVVTSTNDIIISGADGLLYKYNLGTSSWDDIANGSVRVFRRSFRSGSDIIIAADNGYCLYSGDDGVTITQIDTATVATNEIFGVGDGSKKTFTKTLAGYPVRKLSVIITATDVDNKTMTVRDLPGSIFAGDFNEYGTNSINYGDVTSTSSITVTFPRAVKLNSNITITYSYKAFTYYDAYIDGNNVMMCGSKSVIYRSTDLFTTDEYIHLTNTYDQTLRRLCVIDTNSVFVAGDRGFIAKTQYPFPTAWNSYVVLNTGEQYDYTGLVYTDYNSAGYLTGGSHKIAYPAIRILMIKAIGENVMTQVVQRMILERIKELTPIHVLIESISYESTIVDNWIPAATDKDILGTVTSSFYDSIDFTDANEFSIGANFSETPEYYMVPINYRSGDPYGNIQMQRVNLPDSYPLIYRNTNVYPYPEINSTFGEFLNMIYYQSPVLMSNTVLFVPLDDTRYSAIAKEVSKNLHLDNLSYTVGSLGNGTLRAQNDGTSLITDMVLNDVTTAASIECWVKFDDLLSKEVMVSSGNNDTTDFKFILQKNLDKIELLVYDGVNLAKRESNAILADTWYHIVGVYDASLNLDIYIDSILSNGALTGAIPATLTVNNSIALCSYLNGNNRLSGYISLFRLYKIALVINEIELAYQRSYKLYKNNIV